MNADKVKAIELLIKMRELGITQDEVSAMEESLKQKKDYVPDLKAEELLAPQSPFDGISDEEVLYYATPYYDELMAKKELQAKHRKEEEDKDEHS